MRINRPERRPFIFHRWGGLGSHRYPIGFSGDTHSTFGSLAFQPYFTATASNVCFGYWGHDLGGHMQIAPTDPELMLRWLQFGVFSPIFRTHGASQEGNERRIWKYPNFPQLLECVNLRYQLMPYIYTAARQAYDTGISICRPLYYEWPEENEAYRQEGEYMFGDDILVSPVVTAAEAGGKAFQRTWLPEGQWFDVCRNQLVQGASIISGWYAQDEIPYFYRSGAIIPCNPPLRNLKTAPTEMILKVVPGSDGSTTIYEDQGDSQAYIDGEYTQTVVQQQRHPAETVLTIMPRTGAFEGMLQERAYTLQFLDEDKPFRVSLNGTPTSNWTYDSNLRLLTVSIPPVSCDTRTVVTIGRSPSAIGQQRLEPAVERSTFINLPVIFERTVSADGTVTTRKILRK